MYKDTGSYAPSIRETLSNVLHKVKKSVRAVRHGIKENGAKRQREFSG